MEREKQLFLTLSTYLTGFNEVELQGTGMLQTYFETIVKQTKSEILGYFWEEVAQILADTTDEEETNRAIDSRLMPNSAYNGLAKKIITIWYTGTYDGFNVISADAYIQGLMWEAAETHPPAAKQPGFGSWNMPPIKISTH